MARDDCHLLILTHNREATGADSLLRLAAGPKDAVLLIGPCLDLHHAYRLRTVVKRALCTAPSFCIF